MRILIVEDEPRIAKAVKHALQINNYAVDIVSDADSGLSAALDPDYDLVILDRMLPGSMDGIAVCQEVRRADVHTPVLLLTARGEVDDKVEGLQAGADDYLVKPFSMKELVARVHVLLRRPQASVGSIIKLDDLSVDVEQIEVKRAGRPIKLSVREFKLLVYMLHHQGQILSKEKIISHVWDEDASIMPNTVEVYVGYLRKKIDKDFSISMPLIHTVHGFGYKIGGVTNV